MKVVLLLCRIIEPRLSRVCFEEMEGLRDGWDMLLQTSEEVYAKLVREKRGTFEQELDKTSEGSIWKISFESWGQILKNLG